MSKNTKLKNNICFGIGDLIINKETKNVGILMEKHRLVRSAESRTDQNRWAWSIKWSKNPKNMSDGKKNWIKFHACSEEAILEEITGGTIEYYGVNNKKN